MKVPFDTIFLLIFEPCVEVDAAILESESPFSVIVTIAHFVKINIKQNNRNRRDEEVILIVKFGAEMQERRFSMQILTDVTIRHFRKSSCRSSGKRIGQNRTSYMEHDKEQELQTYISNIICFRCSLSAASLCQVGGFTLPIIPDVASSLDST